MLSVTLEGEGLTSCFQNKQNKQKNTNEFVSWNMYIKKNMA